MGLLTFFLGFWKAKVYKLDNALLWPGLVCFFSSLS